MFFCTQLPPGPCLVEDLSGTTVYEKDCPEDYDCGAQAVQYDFQGRSLNYHMCQYPADKLENFVSHLVTVLYTKNKSEVGTNYFKVVPMG